MQFFFQILKFYFLKIVWFCTFSSSLFLRATALDVHLLRRLKVTHVLNAAVGTTQYHVQSNEEIYTKAKIKYLGIEATDFINFDLRPFYEEAANFIDCALKSGG